MRRHSASNLIRVPHAKTLPTVLSREEVKLLLNRIRRPAAQMSHGIAEMLSLISGRPAGLLMPHALKGSRVTGDSDNYSHTSGLKCTDMVAAVLPAEPKLRSAVVMPE